MSAFRFASVVAFVSLAALSGQSVQAQSYSVLDLGTLGGGTLTATALNNIGQVVGSSTTASGATHAFVTGANGLGLTDLGTLGGASSYATAINNAGQVVGRADRADGLTHAFATGANGVGMTDLGTLGGSTSNATGINNKGQIVGYSVASDGNTRAFSAASTGAALVNLGSFSYTNSGVISNFSGSNAVNDSGVVVGYSIEGCNCTGSAFIGQVGVSSINHIGGLTTSASYVSSATAMNAAGQVVGYATGLPGQSFYGGSHAFVTTAAGVTDIGASLGSGRSAAYAINNLGQVGGSFAVGSDMHGFITGVNGVNPVDINSLVAPINGLYFTSVVGLNDLGQVLVMGSNNRSYLFSSEPVPEVSTQAMMALGLGAIGLWGVRRKSRASVEMV